jgi:hypothetical protein
MRFRRRLGLGFLYLNLGPVHSTIRAPGNPGTREARAFTRLGPLAAKVAEAPPEVIEVDRFASADHHSLDGVSELDEGSVKRHVALNVVPEPPHGESLPVGARAIGGSA